MSHIKPAILCYIPNKSFGNPQDFLDNLAANPTEHELIKFSHADWDGCLKLKGSPEILVGAVDDKGKPKPYAVSNLIFFTALRIARSAGYTEILYVEPDCRVGPGWDVKMFKEFYSRDNLIQAGSVVTHNPFNTNLETALRWKRFIRDSKGPLPVVVYGNKGCAETGSTVTWTNGALSIYSMAELLDIFTPKELDDSAGLARKSLAWDLEIGIRLSNKHGIRIFDRTKHLACSWSTYGNVLSTEAERLKMLADGDVIAIHQVKGKKT